MANYKIITDSACDLPVEMLQELDVTTVALTVNFRGETRNDSVDDAQVKELYDAMRAGEVATTAAVNPDGWSKVIEPALEAGSDVLVMAFSSGLSTTYQSAEIAADELREKYPERKIIVVDTRAAALGQGLFIWHTCKKRDAGLSLEELAVSNIFDEFTEPVGKGCCKVNQPEKACLLFIGEHHLSIFQNCKELSLLGDAHRPQALDSTMKSSALQD